MSRAEDICDELRRNDAEYRRSLWGWWKIVQMFQGPSVYERAADEIERLRGQIEHHKRDRIEYCAAWLKWIEANDGLEIAQWCRAYADAVPYANPDGPEIVCMIHSRLDARHRMAADEIERLRRRVAKLNKAVRKAGK